MKAAGYGARGRRVPFLLIGGIFCLFLGDSIFQIALPTVFVEKGGYSATVAGLMLSLGLGLGVLFVAPAAQFSDIRRRADVLRLVALPLTLIAVLFAIASSLDFHLIIWLVPLVTYGLIRTPALVMLLAFVTERGDKLRMQAANGVAQRSAVAAAAAVVSLFVYLEKENLVFLLLSLVFLIFLGLVVLVHRYDVAPSRKEAQLQQPVRRSLELLKTRSLKASSALNSSMVLVTILGNAFFPLGLLGESASVTAGWVLTFLVTRDLFGALLAGTVFKRLYSRIGIIGVLLLTTVLIVGGLALLALPGREPSIVILSALMQGFACASGIGCTNLLAAHGGGTEERALRIGATQYLPAAVMLIAPTPLGFILDISTIHHVFLAGALLAASLMSYVLFQISPRRNSVASDLKRGLTI